MVMVKEVTTVRDELGARMIGSGIRERHKFQQNDYYVVNTTLILEYKSG